MFVFKPTTKTYSDPVAATFTPGIPFGREKSKGDICLLHEGFSASKIFLNSHVLREAILNSKDYLEEVLQLRITDKVGKEPKKVKAEDVDKAEVYVSEDKQTVTITNANITSAPITIGTPIENSTTTTVSEETLVTPTTTKKKRSKK